MSGPCGDGAPGTWTMRVTDSKRRSMSTSKEKIHRRGCKGIVLSGGTGRLCSGIGEGVTLREWNRLEVVS